jgi:hypothetical protein
MQMDGFDRFQTFAELTRDETEITVWQSFRRPAAVETVTRLLDNFFKF